MPYDIKQKTQLTLGRADRTRVLLEGRQMIFVSCERAYATSYSCLTETLALFLSVSEIRRTI